MRLAIVIILGFNLKLLDALNLAFGKCLLLLEEPCNNDLVKFLLYANNKVEKLDIFSINGETFNSTVQTKIVVHGYGGLSIDYASRNVTEAYRIAGYNVIEVDWSPLASTPCYVTSFINTWHVGQCIAIFIFNLIVLGLSPEKLHIVGFSLGAHIAGLTSNNLLRTTGSRIGRITGLDPALPMFASAGKGWKLDSSDAEFVDVIHTNAGTFGKIEASGDVDFYVNGGMIQPKCYNAKHPPLCSHLTAGLYFAESIFSDRFVAVKCSNILHYILGLCDKSSSEITIMGENCDTKSKGIYFVNTIQ